MSHQVKNKRQSTFPDLVGQNQKLDTAADGKLSDDLDYASVFIKVIGHKLSKDSISDLYTRCRMNFVADPVQTQTLQFMDLGFLTINALDERIILCTFTTIIKRPTGGAHWSAPNHIFGETSAVKVSEEKSDYDYNYKTRFQIWK